MQINGEYKKIKCIEKLEEQYKKPFFKIVGYYAEKLPEQLLMDGSAYTMHDFNHHCINIYKIISEIILYPRATYDEGGLSQKELYILNLAVLFHDIGMSSYLDSERKNHSRKSSEYIQKIYHTEDSVFRRESALNENEVKALRLIVMAHSDIKDGSMPENEYGLNNSELKDEIPAQVGKIRAKFLACILRLADELDITVERLGNGDTESQLGEMKERRMAAAKSLEGSENLPQKDENKPGETDGYAESLKHWERLHLFSEIHRAEEGNGEICIIVNDDHVRRQIESGDTYEHLADSMAFVYKKVHKELREGLLKKIEESRNKLELRNMISVEAFRVVSGIDEINNSIAKKLNYLDCENTEAGKESGNKGEDGGSDEAEDAAGKILPEIISEEFQGKLNRIVKRKQLLKVGHFLLDEDYCARDWLDTKEIIETGEIMDDIVVQIMKHINTKFGEEEDCLFLGLDLEGAILASRVGMAMQRPFSYLIPAKEVKNNAGKDVEAVTGRFKKYIIFTDAVVTYKTIADVLESIDKSEDGGNILQIYAIFYRESIRGSITKKLAAKTTCISRDFSVELFEKKDCPYKKEYCFGMNRKINE